MREKIVLQKLAVEKVVNNPHKKDARILLFDIYSVTLLVKKLIENNVDLYEMSIQRNSLEDVFHALTTEKTEEKSDGK